MDRAKIQRYRRVVTCPLTKRNEKKMTHTLTQNIHQDESQKEMGGHYDLSYERSLTHEPNEANQHIHTCAQWRMIQ